MASTEQPKKSPSGYFLYLSDRREAIAKEIGTSKGSAVAKKVAEKWKAETPAARKPYEDKAAKLKAEYDAAMQAFKAGGGVASRKARKGKRKQGNEDSEDGDGQDVKKKRAKKQKDPDAPKRPAGGGYGVYLSMHREEIAKSLPSGHKISEVAKVAGVRWKALSDSGKKVYEDKYAVKKAEFDKAMQEYKAKSPTSNEQVSKKRSADETEKKNARPKKASKGASAQDEVEIDAAVLAAAKKAGMEVALKNLASRPEIAALGLSSKKLLMTLEENNGLVNASKHALLRG